MGSLTRLMDDFTKAMSAKLGITFVVKEYSYPKGDKVAMDLVREVKAGNGDFTYVNAIEYLLDKKEIDKVMSPSFTILMLNKNHTDVCAYVRADAPCKSVKDLQGETWGGVETMPTRLLMYRDGVNKPLASFFGEVTYLNDADITRPSTPCSRMKSTSTSRPPSSWKWCAAPRKNTKQTCANSPAKPTSTTGSFS